MKTSLGLLILAAAGFGVAGALPCAAQGVTPPAAVANDASPRQQVGIAGAVGVERLPRCEPGAERGQPIERGRDNMPATPGGTVSAAGYIAPADPPAPVESVPTPRSLATTNLAAAIETALERNPNLVALRQSEPVSQAALGVARTYPFNPYAQVQVLPYSHEHTGGTTPVSHYVLLMQTLELAHQPRFREAAGMADLSRTRWTIHQAELVNIALTERMFFTAIYQRGVRDLTLSLARLNEDLVGVLDRRFNAGTALASDVALARLQAHAARQQANLTATTYNTALWDLRTQLGLVSNEPFEPQGDLLRLEWQKAPVTLAAEGKLTGGEVIELVSARPDVMAARADVELSRAGANLARANRVPNLQVGPYYARDDFATTFLGLRSQVDIPIMNNGMPLLRQRMAEVRQREIALEQLQTRARLEADAALERYERARRLIDNTQTQFARTLAEDVRLVEDQFRSGQADLLRVYSARTGLIQAERAMLDTLNELAQAAARVTETTGLPPYVLVRPATESPAPPDRQNTLPAPPSQP